MSTCRKFFYFFYFLCLKYLFLFFIFLCRDLSYNNLSGSLPKISARTFKWVFPPSFIVIISQWCLIASFIVSFLFRIVGNSLLCEHNSNNDCSVVYPEPLSFPPDGITGIYHTIPLFFLYIYLFYWKLSVNETYFWNHHL